MWCPQQQDLTFKLRKATKSDGSSPFCVGSCYSAPVNNSKRRVSQAWHWDFVRRCMALVGKTMTLYLSATCNYPFFPNCYRSTCKSRVALLPHRSLRRMLHVDYYGIFSVVGQDSQLTVFERWTCPTTLLGQPCTYQRKNMSIPTDSNI